MNEAAIVVRGLSKTFDVPVRDAGLGAAVASVFRRRTRAVEAVKDVSFEVQAGEIVGFLGPNGAGKTTTLKMLSGLLHPSAGSALALGFRPEARKKEFLRQITLVMGQRNQLIWDIPVIDSFERNRAIYRIERESFRKTIDELADLLELGELLRKPVRTLSLGERMKCEVAVALLHRPRLLFLDEPTIGLDVTMQRRIRAFIARYNQTTGASVLLTSHYMADIEALCRRVIVIHHGRILYDGALDQLLQRFASHKTLTLELAEPATGLERFGEVVQEGGLRARLRVAKADTAAVTARLLTELPIKDLTVEDPPTEEIIERVFAAETR
jgi:ABC-2 type transport system ATP-binding protein